MPAVKRWNQKIAEGDAYLFITPEYNHSALTTTVFGPGATAGDLSGALRAALDGFDEPAAQAVLDRLVSDLSLTTVLREVVLPFLAELGQRWERL